MRFVVFKKRCTVRYSLAACCFCLLLSSISRAQATAYYLSKNIDTIYALIKDESKATPFYFPQSNELTSLNEGYRIHDEQHQFVLARNRDVSNPQNLLFLTRLFCYNVKTISFTFTGKENQKTIDFSISRNGYQSLLSSAINFSDSTFSKFRNIQLNVSYKKIKDQDEATVIVGSMMIGDEHLNKFLSPVKLFQNAPFNNAKEPTAYITSRFDSYGFYSHFPEDQIEENFKGTVYVEDTNTNSSQLLGSLCIALLENYPFYKERGLSRTKTLTEVKKVIAASSGMPLDRYVKELNTFLITKVKDPHFFIDCKLPNIKRPVSPIAVSKINDHYQVAAVFDDSLKSLLPIGSIILKVDDIKVKAAREIARLNQLLRKTPGEEVALSFKSPAGKQQTIHYKIKDRYTVPPAFRPVNLALKPLNDTTIYYKINQINTELTLDFVSKLDTINKRKKLILDFRGCGGGDVIAGAQFISFFTDGPFKYFDFEPLNSDRKDSVIVQGNTSPFRYRKDGRIVILADNNTACTAELIIYRLREMKNYDVAVIGKENTRGALAILTEIMLPAKDVSIGTNAMITGKMLLDGKSIENIGIRPDIHVQVNAITDLQPYNDKVLKTAILN